MVFLHFIFYLSTLANTQNVRYCTCKIKKSHTILLACLLVEESAAKLLVDIFPLNQGSTVKKSRVADQSHEKYNILHKA